MADRECFPSWTSRVRIPSPALRLTMFHGRSSDVTVGRRRPVHRRCSLAAGQLALLVSISSLVVGTPESSRPRWQLVWHDEFDNPVLDAGKWVRETGGAGSGNGELEFYTHRAESARIEGGNLIIEARRE